MTYEKIWPEIEEKLDKTYDVLQIFLATNVRFKDPSGKYKLRLFTSVFTFDKTESPSQEKINFIRNALYTELNSNAFIFYTTKEKTKMHIEFETSDQIEEAERINQLKKHMDQKYWENIHSKIANL